MAACSCPENEQCGLLITCEHGGNLVPASLAYLFAGEERLLSSHRGYDRGALETACLLARAFQAPLCYTVLSRLVIDCNRSPGNFRRFSLFTGLLGREERERLTADFQHPYHRAVNRAMAQILAERTRVVHVAVHTFTPELNGTLRMADVGLLYNPARPAERAFCRCWRKELLELAPGLRVRRNYPYLGKTDGLPAMLRKRYPDRQYIGIELEINQAGLNRLEEMADTLAVSLHLALQAFC